MDDKMSGVQEILDGFRKKVDELTSSLNDQKRNDMDLKIESLRVELQSQIEKLSMDVRDLQSKASAPAAQAPAPSPVP